MALTLTQRYTNNPKLALHNGVYWKDFAPTRHATVGRKGSSLFTFKKCDSEITSDWERGRLHVYVPHVFGRVLERRVLPELRGVAVKMGRPVRVSCSVQAMFSDQMAKLQEIIDIEDQDVGGKAASSWFCPFSGGVRHPREAETFYVYLRISSSRVDRMISVGDNLELPVSLARIDTLSREGLKRSYKLNAWEFTLLDFSDLPLRVEGDGCDVCQHGCNWCASADVQASA